jgi:4-hydroxy-tetrahydrodipicolinate reductase
MISVAITGACGRMAGQVLRRCAEDDNVKVVAAVDVKHQGEDVGEFLGVGEIGVNVSDDLGKAIGDSKPDLLVDFTNPEAAVKNAKIAAEKGVNFVVGTTGLSDKQMSQLKEAAENNKVAGMYASNFSVGMNVLFKLAKDTAKTLEGYDIEIIEAHHNKKKDAPSGTAKTLAKLMEESLGRDLKEDAVYGREGMVGERRKGEIGIHAIRAGDIAGEHTVLFGQQGERLELKYAAHSRDAFAMGCVRAINWMEGKEPGFYSMLDVLGL